MNRIKQLREEFNFSQNDLAERLGGAPSSVAMYEKGERKPSLDVLVKLSEIFGCTVDYLLCKSYYRNYDEFIKLDNFVTNYALTQTPEESTLIANTLNYINSHKSENIDDIISNSVKSLPSDKQDTLKKILYHLHYRYHGIIPKKQDKEEQDFQYAYHKEMEGLTDEEISDALRFYKEMKKRINKDK